MHISVLHKHRRPWPRPVNHLDGRVCPTCKMTCHGFEAQVGHENYHLDERQFRLDVIDRLAELMKRTGMTEEAFPVDWAWNASIEGSGEDGSEDE